MPTTTTTTDFSSSDYEMTSTEADTGTEQDYKKEKRLFWSDGNAIGDKSFELEVPGFNSVEPGYLADDETDTEDKVERIEIKCKKRPSDMSKSSSLFFSDSDGFEERAVL
uniref:TIP_N domain-containing protein n=1 Tax=Caenorhabditis tropicalis TaxID=1561998 RepID=A0A1I7U1A2_9PELO